MLPVLALLRSGVAPQQLTAQFAWLDAQPLRETYSVALYIMALEALHVRRTALPPQRNSRSVTRFDRTPVPADVQDRMQRAVRWLVATRKHGEGWWSYSGHVDDLDESPPVARRPVTERSAGTDGSTRERKAPEGDDAVVDRPADPAGGPLDHQGGPAARGDHSNTQFAVLALHSAQASGVDVPAHVWEEIYEEFLGSQEHSGPDVSLEGTIFSGASSLPVSVDRRDLPQGTTVARGAPATTHETPGSFARGWSYGTRGAGRAYGSMAAAGASSMAVAREGLRETGRLTADRSQGSLRSLRDGLAWLLQNLDVTGNPGKDAHYYYWLYSLEKAMDTAGVERLGQREWWREAALELINRQRPDGSWGDAIDTSFALLVLNRATLPARVDVQVGRARVATGVQAAAPWDRVHVDEVGQLSVRQVLKALDQGSARDAKRHLRLGQKALAALDQALRPRVLPELAQLVDSGHRGVRTWARRECRLMTGSTDGDSIRAAYERWEELYAIRKRGDSTGIPRARASLRERSPLCVRRAALETLRGLRAFEALGDLASALDADQASEREAVWVTLRALGGDDCPAFDPLAKSSTRADQVSRIKAWCERATKPLVKAEQIRRAVADLGSPARARAAERVLLAAGRAAVRDLIDGLRGADTRERAHDLLCEITGESFKARVGPWLEWLEVRAD